MHQFCHPQYVMTPDVVALLQDTVGIEDVESLTAMFFLLSKSEHDNERWDDMFRGNDGFSVFFFAKALDYDRHERGVTVGIAGWTTANGGKDQHGDFIRLAERYKRLGGLDLRQESKGLTDNPVKAKKFERMIRKLHGDYGTRFVKAQFKELCSPGGYVYEASNALRNAGIVKPSALAVAAVMDTIVNQGIGGRWCAIDWLRDHRTTDETALLDGFLAWKRISATKNHHNSPPVNGKNRADMFKNLLDTKEFALRRKACENVVRWTMK